MTKRKASSSLGTGGVSSPKPPATSNQPPTTVWHNCYDGNHKDLITRESFAHPAKMSRVLCERIFDYGRERGYWQPGDCILDPFGGIGTTGLIGAYRGYRVISVELEPRFVALAKENIEKNRAKLERLGRPLPIHLQGDSRRLIELLQGEARGVISSPPFSTPGNQPVIGQGTRAQMAAAGRLPLDSQQAQTEGNLADLKPGDLESVVGCISSPPYADSLEKPNGIYASKIKKAGGPNAQAYVDPRYGSTVGQIGALKAGDVSGAITSPPFEDSTSNEVIDQEIRKTEAKKRGIANSANVSPIDLKQNGGVGYGSTNGQIGSESGETYWQAVAVIYGQLFQLLPSGGACAIVVKDYVKNKQVVPLCDQTCQLLEAVGFHIVERIHASLVKEHTTQTLFGVDQTKRTERKSFFRRLAEKKGSPRIDWEEVIWAVKP